MIGDLMRNTARKGKASLMLLAAAGLLSACAPRTEALLPDDLRATLATAHQESAPKTTPERILAIARGDATADGPLAGPATTGQASVYLDSVESPVAGQPIHDTAQLDPRTTADIAKADRAFAPPSETIDNTEYSTFAAEPVTPDALFATYRANSTFAEAADDTAFDADPQALFAEARALSSAAEARPAQATDSGPELFERARRLAAAQQAAPTAESLDLAFHAGTSSLEPEAYRRLGAFIKTHPNGPFLIRAGLASSGSAFAKIALAETRLKEIAALTPQFETAKREVAPDLAADHLEIRVTD